MLFQTSFICSHYNQTFLGIHGGLVPGPPRVPKSAEAQVPYIKWPITVSPSHQ